MQYPYIGITGVTTPVQATHLLQIYDQHRNGNKKPLLHLGAMMSHKTLRGLPTRWAPSFPKKETLHALFRAMARRDVLSCLHYADYDGIDVEDSLVEAFSYVCPEANALQLDMVWPDPDEVGSAIARGWEGDSPTVILQVGPKALAEVDHQPNKLAERLANYAGVVDYVLLDESAGTGQALRITRLVPLAHKIREKLPWVALGIAGGLGPDTVVKLAGEFLTAFPGSSIDAQSMLCTNFDARHPLNLMSCGQYMRRAFTLYPG